MLTSPQPKTTPKTPATLHLLRASTPSAPFHLQSVDLVDSSASGWFYDVSDICLLPGSTVVAAVGTAKKDNEEDELLVMLFDRQEVSGQEQLVKLAEVRQPQFAVNPFCGTTTARYFRGVREALVHQVGSDVLLFAVGPVDPKGRSIEAVAAAKLDPAAALEADRVQWYTSPSHVFDAPYWVKCELPGGPSSPEWHEWSANTLAAVADGGSPEKHWLYVGGGADVELQEFEITDFHQNGFPAPTDMGLQEDEPIFWIDAHHDAATGVDILLVAGLTHIHAIKRVDPMWPGDYGTTPQKFGVTVDGHVMRETYGGGPKDMLWTVSADTNSPWTIFDVTERPLIPGVLPPDKEQSFYLPGGADGAVAVPEWSSLYAGTFGGVVRYDLVGPVGATNDYSVLPDTGSYRPATVAGHNHVVEQLELATSAQGDRWLVGANAIGGAVVWKLDPGSADPLAASVISPPWSSWLPDDPLTPANEAAGTVYGHRATFGVAAALGDPFLLFDFAKYDGPAEQAKLGRYRTDFHVDFDEVPATHWQEVDLLPGAPGGCLRGPVTDVAVSPDGRWIFAGMENGFVVVENHSEHGTDVMTVTDSVHTAACGGGTPLDPFGTLRDYIQVEGIASYQDFVVVNATHKDDSSTQPPAAVALYAFDSTTGEVGSVLAVYEGDVPGSAPDALAGVKLWGGGPVRIHELEPGLARVYTASNEYGTVVEFELDARGATPTFVPLAWWHNGSHFTQTTDVRPYDLGDPSGLPLVLVSRYRQTIGLVRAAPSPEEE